MITILIGLQALVFVSGNLSVYIVTNSISIGILFLSMATLPLVWVETIVGPIISRIIKSKNKHILNHFININFKNVLFFCFIFSMAVISLSFIPNFFEFFFYKYFEYKQVVFIFAFLVLVIGSKIYLSWFSSLFKKNKIHFIIMFVCLFYLLYHFIN